MDLNDVRNLLNTISGDKLKGKKLSPEQFELIAHQASLKHFKLKTGLPEAYQPGMPITAQAYEITRKNTIDLMPFKVHMGKYGEVPLAVDENGYAAIPANMYYPSTMAYQYNGEFRDIDIVSDLEWNHRQIDALTKPTLRNPISNLQNGYIRFAPVKNNFVEFVYLKTPVAPVFGYTQENGYVEYVSSLSTEFEWDDINIISIVMIMLFDLGINMEKQEVLQVADKIKKEGV